MNKKSGDKAYHSFTNSNSKDGNFINAANDMFSKKIEDNKTSFKIKSLSSDYMIPAELIYVSPEDVDLEFSGNKRDASTNDVSDLVDLIKKTNGNTEAVYVRKHPDKSSPFLYQIIKGKRRTKSCRIAKLKLKAICAEFSDDDAFDFATHENLGSMPLDHFELGDTLKAVVESKKFTMTEAAKLFKNRSGKPLSRTGAYKIMECSNIPDTVRKKILDKATVDVNVIIKLKNTLTLIYEGHDIEEVTEYLDTLEPLEGKVLIAQLSDKFFLNNEELKSKIKFINKHEGKLLFDKMGIKIGSVASFSTGAPHIRFTKDIEQDKYDEIIDYIQNKLKE